MKLTTIHKYRLEIVDQVIIKIPADHSFLHVDLDAEGMLCAWFAVDPQSKKVEFEFRIVGTGSRLPHVGDHLGTVRMAPFIWHIFTGPGHAKNVAAFHYVTKDNG